jgi:pyruvate/2-oxoglutarate dehydrogenase complex dihydrolipoamide dehydrogenase (E3) component
MTTERSLEQYDAILIGAGQANNPLSTTLAQAGWKVALIEQEHVGGTCVNEGCTPTKTMIASARVAHLARRSSDYGVHTGPVTVDMEEVRRRKRDIVTRFRTGSRQRVEAAEGVDLLMGQARFTGPKAVMVELNQGGARHLTADYVFINVGQRPRIPDLPGLESVAYLDSTSVMELSEVPEHLIVVGGGYVGVEFGQMFRRFGAEVTIVQRSGQLLTHEDLDVAKEVAEILRQDGIRVLLNTDAVRVKQDAEGIYLTVSTSEEDLSQVEPATLTGSHLLVAAGRVPNVESLDLDAAGIETTGRGHIKANERLETNVVGVYALGDVKGGPAFTHISYDDFRVIWANLLERGDRSTGDRPVPYTVFIDPQLGGIGLTEKQARRQGRSVKIAKMPMSHVARALETDETRGLMKVIIDADTDQIIGAAILGVEGGEVMSVLQMAMMGGVPYTVLRDAVFAHPTLTESLNNLFMMS